jgi:hypothetical protein
MQTRLVLLACLSTIAIGAAAKAAPVAIDNPSFEAQPLADGAAVPGGFDTAAGWNETRGFTLGWWNPTAADFPNGVPDGSNVGYVYAGHNGSPLNANSALIQLLSIVVQTNTRYTLTVDVGNAMGADNFGGFTFGLIGQAPGGGAYQLLDSLSGAADSVADGVFRTFSLAFETGMSGTGSTMGIILTGGMGAIGSQYAVFDNVRLDATALAPVETPEPAALAFLALGLLGLGAARRHRHG